AFLTPADILPPPICRAFSASSVVSMIFLGIASANLGVGPRFFSRISAPVFYIKFNYTCTNKKVPNQRQKKYAPRRHGWGCISLYTGPPPSPLMEKVGF